MEGAAGESQGADGREAGPAEERWTDHSESLHPTCTHLVDSSIPQGTVFTADLLPPPQVQDAGLQGAWPGSAGARGTGRGSGSSPQHSCASNSLGGRGRCRVEGPTGPLGGKMPSLTEARK